ncbi:MAG: hypothetical protein ACD_23C00091G0001 [uncultured bacterium]|nr:MAG: hypothetical protein ACD_23C00091G0001 [uncultured bacterium]
MDHLHARYSALAALKPMKIKTRNVQSLRSFCRVNGVQPSQRSVCRRLLDFRALASLKQLRKALVHE